MSAPLPDVLRTFQRYIEEGWAGRGWFVAHTLTGHRGVLGACDPSHRSSQPTPQGHPLDKGKLDPHHRAFFTELILQYGDITMQELAATLLDTTGIQVHPNAIGEFLRRSGSHTKKSPVAAERHSAKIGSYIALQRSPPIVNALSLLMRRRGK